MAHDLQEATREPRVAYFSMEIALRSEIQTYAGGLGVLAGDTLRAAADLSLALVGVSLVSREGYFHQEIDEHGRQIERAATWDPARWAQPLDAKVAVRIAGRAVWVGAWLYVIESHMGGVAPVVLLDTDLPENAPDDRKLTHYLYGGDETYRLQQEIVLGIGGVRLLHALGFELSAYHMNEGHSALLGLELLRRYAYSPDDLRPGESPYDLPRVRELCRFTTHTPVEAGHDRFPYELVRRLFFNSSASLGDEERIELAMIQALGGSDALNMTRLALNLSEFVNGVAQRHAEVSARMFPGYHVRAITNGVHPFTWTAPSFRDLYNRYVPGWCHEPELLVRADRIPDAAILDAHAQAKQMLIDRVRAATGASLRADVPILAFARRMTAYKRPDLVFTDLARLKAIAREQPLQIVLAGKAHPRDEEGKRLIAFLHAQARALADAVPCVYLPDYDMSIAQSLVAGADVWLNTPLPPYEASGTSGMKAAFNGVPSFSVLDGWWIEGCIEGVTGWAIDDATSLYDKLERVILPLYRDKAGWVRVMLGAIAKNAAYFNSHRMMRRYATEAYLG
ncbi:MAG TPA: alpha-glucan family phosphorylase [Steroidobacteraceae bacterium]|jgi:starch phosphorylase|nr:alpha-glucan family phosphorylase [Steroidobacteraceae bacterium]